MNDRISKAVEQASRAAAGDLKIGPRGIPTRLFAVGDPQATCERLFEVLDRAGILGEDGLLAKDAGLISIGDHFDYETEDRDAAGREGMAILSWLAAHDGGQARILVGNHDVSRVMELVSFDDPTFREAREAGRKIHDARKAGKDGAVLESDFASRFPALPNPDIARRDYSSFSTGQRGLLMRLLLEGRLKLADVARKEGTEVLLTHAAVANRELGLLGIPEERSARVIAAKLNVFLDAAIERVRPQWERGELAPLDLAPLQIGGSSEGEGGGLMYHRPANPDERARKSADLKWEFDGERPRRFAPQELPRGLAQIAGHTGHKKCLEELVPFFDASLPEMQAGASCSLRTLTFDEAGVRYEPGVRPHRPGAATLWLIDGTMNRNDGAEVLPLDA